MTIFEANCAALSTKNPELVDKIQSSAGGLVFPKRARSGQLTAYIEQSESQNIRWLHSSYDPEGEAKRIVQASYSSGAETVVVIGMGLGYTVRELIKEQCQVLIVEPDVALMRSCFELVDIQDILKNPLVYLLAEPDYETLMLFLQELDPRSVLIFENPAYMNLYPEQCAMYTGVVQKFKEKDIINKNTIKRFGKRWVRNIVKNLLELESFIPLKAYRGLMEGLPILVLAAGPSLDSILPYVHELSRRFVLVAVDTACKSVKTVDCTPDFVVVADPQYWNARHLDWAVFPESRLVSEIAVWPSVFHTKWKHVLLAASQYPLGKYIESYVSLELGPIRAGGSVATSAWDFARQLGASTIYMAGLDLAYPNCKSHARASTFEQHALHSATKFKPAETALFIAVNSANAYCTSNYSGSTVKTDKRLALYAWWFSRMCMLYPDPPTRNLSSEGFFIPEMARCTIEDLLALPECRNSINERLLTVSYERLTIQGKELLKDLHSKLAGLMALLQHGITAIEAAIEGKNTMQSVLKLLDTIEANLMKNETKDLVGFLLPDIDEKLGPKPKTLEESLLVTKRLYEDITKSTEWHIKIIEHYLF